MSEKFADQGKAFPMSRTFVDEGQGARPFKGQGHTFEDEQTLKRMEAISVGRWLDDIPPIFESRIPPPIADNRLSSNIDNIVVSQPNVNKRVSPVYDRRSVPYTGPRASPNVDHRSSGSEPPSTIAGPVLPLSAVLKTAMADSSFSDQSSFDTSLIEMANSSAGSEVKYEGPQSPNEPGRFSFSRASSTGSIPAVSHSSASSAQNSDDEDSDSTIKSSISFKDRRREAHTHAEQKRRDAIKKGYDELQGLVPTCQQTDTLGSAKLSKAAILQRSIDYINLLVKQKSRQEDDLDNLRKEVMALKIMKSNYEHIVKAHQNTPQHGQNQVSDEAKFQVFQLMMDSLFQSFNNSISVANFAELSGSIFSWLEEYCKPQTLRDLTVNTLRQVPQQQQQQLPPH